ncbi:MAG: copper homeostasis protein [Planctomycetota bacterium]|jgi:copper homeostasis protein
MTLLEVCVDSLGSARKAAVVAGRIEFCARLDLGGTTPDFDDLRELCSSCSLPVYAMIRPRAGNFIYDDEELVQMEEHLELVKTNGAAGAVLGVADPAGVRVKEVRRLLKASGDMPVTFHRAFDEIEDKERALEELIDLGIARVLTTGGPPTAWEGRESLRRLIEQAAGRITVMPGGGVRKEHVLELLRYTGAVEVHSSRADVMRW